ncbi:MATE family efflux transporter [Streptomyces sp. B93]|uniref:MATE family efflux transporter n=1 Tax=Streptomyces sp. B93 TaxID=2824875 RepID=UPI001B36DB03|nr:MATE family efflux transporter [Streptomyces sp. B93]MBQ1089391.1 MATE family efflux transporter [Streptomyces sp. B93]
MRHTELTRRNFAGYAGIVLLMSSVGAAFSAVDLAMVAPLGLRYVAAVGLADLVVTGVLAFAGGLVRVFCSRLAIAEGEGERGRRLPVLLMALLWCGLACQLLLLPIAWGSEWFLDLIGQDPELVPLTADYIVVRLLGVMVLVGYAAVSEALKICGMKNLSFGVVSVGFFANAGLNYLVLYTSIKTVFASPAQAVAVSTVIVQVLMAGGCAALFRQRMRAQGERFERPAAGEVRTEFRSMARIAPGIGARDVNDYMAAIVPFLFIGTLSPGSVAAAVVASKIYTLFCRVPQSCVAGVFTYYGYQVGKGATPRELARRGRTLLWYTAIPTAVGTLLIMVSGPWLVQVFGGGEELDVRLATILLAAFMATMPLYVLEAVYSAVLTIHQRAALLSVTSAVTTYGIMIPLSWYAVFVLESAFWAIALGGIVSSVVIVAVLWRAVHRDHWAQAAAEPAAVGGV